MRTLTREPLRRGFALLLAAGLALGGCQCSDPGAGPGDGGARDGAQPADAGRVDAGTDCDVDDDGYESAACGGTDCNDLDPNAHPGATEICDDNRDNDCNGQPDEGCPCQDGASRGCYGGDPATQGQGLCVGGTQHCRGGIWGDCEADVVPVTEFCDGLDNDCDGELDEGLTNACGTCEALPAERCGDALDSDCDGQLDPPGGCATECHHLPDDLAARCQADPAADSRCCCVLAPDSCASCVERTDQPCYTGPPGTLGLGRCRGGLADCTGGAWGTCVGQVMPEPELCNNDIDEDCNGLVDDGCQSGCVAAPEACDGLDNDCNGAVDEGCNASAGSQTCYLGPAASANVGECRSGIQVATGEFWGPCEGAVAPTTESCNGLDDDCDGHTDEGCCRPNPAGLDASGAEAVCNGLDDDCDGLIDEGLVNACGRCPPEPCYVETWPDPATGGWECTDCNLDGVGEGDPANPDSLCGAGQICLDRARFDQPYIWIADTGANQVRRINTRTFQTELQVTSYGWSPSRTAVAVDGSVWVGNRGCQNMLSNCQGGNPAYGNAAHIATDGTLICRADVTGNDVAVRAITLDGNDNAWIGSWSEGTLYQYSGSQVDATQTPPRCVQLRRIDLLGSRAYGAAVNSEGDLWIATLGTGPTRKIDTSTGQILTSITLPYPAYGIAIDQQDNVWFGAWDTQGGLMRIDAGTHQVTHHKPPDPNCGVTEDCRTRGVAVDFDGNLWVADWNRATVQKYAPSGTFLGRWNVGAGPLGVAVDNDGRIWTVNMTGNSATVLQSNGVPVTTVTGLQTPYTYSDMTGLQLRLVTRQGGVWISTWDSGWPAARWSRVEWTASLIPTGGEVCVRARTAETRAGLTTAAWSAKQCSPPIPHSPPPATASLAGLVGPGRYIQVEVSLKGAGDQSPVVDEVEVFWERP